MRRLRKNIRVPSKLTLNEKLTFVIGICTIVVAIGSTIIAYQTLKLTENSTDATNAIAQLARIADKTNSEFEVLEGQLKEAREHDRMLAQEATSFLLDLNSTQEIGIYVENNGQGPAYLRQLKVYVDGRLLKGTSEIAKTWQQAKSVRTHSVKYHEFNTGRMIRPGDKWSLFYIDRKDVRDMNAFTSLVRDHIFIIGEACDLYWKCQMLCTRGNPDGCENIEKDIQIAAAGTIR